MATPICWRFQLGAIGKLVLLFVLNSIFASKAFAQFCPMTKRYLTGGIRIHNFYDKNKTLIDPNKDTSFVMKVFFTKEGKIYKEIKFRLLPLESDHLIRHGLLGRITLPLSNDVYGIYYSEQLEGVELLFIYRLVIRYKEDLMVVDLSGFMKEKYLQKGQVLEPQDLRAGGGIMDSLVFQPGYFQFNYRCDSIQESRKRLSGSHPFLHFDGLTPFTAPLLISAGCLQYIPDVEQSITKELEFDRYSHEMHEEDED